MVNKIYFGEFIDSKNKTHYVEIEYNGKKPLTHAVVYYTKPLIKINPNLEEKWIIRSWHDNLDNALKQINNLPKPLQQTAQIVKLKLHNT